MKNQRPVKKSIKKAGKLGQRPKQFRRESRKPNPKVMVQRSPLHGLGLWAQYPIKAGEFLVEYVGQIITAEENEALQSHTDDPNHTFSFGLECGLIIDGGVEGNISRYINHSCAPNAEFREVPYAEGCPLEKNSRLFIYATQDIGAGEEIFFDYSLQYDGVHTKEVRDTYRCLCGAATCRGTMIDLSYKPKLSPKERLTALEEHVESLQQVVEAQGSTIQTQAELITALSNQVLEMARRLMGDQPTDSVQPPADPAREDDDLLDPPGDRPEDALDGDEALVDKLVDTLVRDPGVVELAVAPRTFQPKPRRLK